MTSTLTGSQLALPFPREPSYSAFDFIEDTSNQEALAWLGRTADWPAHRLLLWGSSGCGKTHLLHIWAQQAGASVMSARALSDLPEALSQHGIAIDDTDAAVDERALLHLLNVANETASPVLLASRSPPARWPIQLPDLASRLRAVTAVEIGAPEDSLLRRLLIRLLAERQLVVPGAVQDWILRALPRTSASLRDAVIRLDKVALEQRRPITVPLAKRVLADVIGPQSDEISASAAAPSPE